MNPRKNIKAKQRRQRRRAEWNAKYKWYFMCVNLHGKERRKIERIRVDLARNFSDATVYVLSDGVSFVEVGKTIPKSDSNQSAPDLADAAKKMVAFNRNQS